MAKMSEKTTHYLIYGAIIIVAIIVIFKFFRPSLNVRVGSATPSGQSTIPQFLASTSGPAGTTNPGVLNGMSANGTPNLAFQTYNYQVPIPSFHYSGNSQIYMPLFGFVGYSTQGTL